MQRYTARPTAGGDLRIPDNSHPSFTTLPFAHPLTAFCHAGNEAGGHGGASSPSTFTLVSEVLAALPNEGAPPVLAAGGIANGTQVAAYLTLGASGAVLGTRFLLTPECPWPEAHKAALLTAKSGSSIRTLAMDYALGLYGWPKGLNGRAIRNQIYEDIEAGVPHDTVRERLAKANEDGNVDYNVIWCGQGVSLMHEIKPVKVSGRISFLLAFHVPDRWPRTGSRSSRRSR